MQTSATEFAKSTAAPSEQPWIAQAKATRFLVVEAAKPAARRSGAPASRAAVTKIREACLSPGTEMHGVETTSALGKWPRRPGRFSRNVQHGAG